MVGVVIFKDFETGSFEKMTITCFRGDSYADIEREREFCSYGVSDDGFCIDVISSTPEAFCPGYTALKEVYDGARKFFFDNIHCTVAEFIKQGQDISFRLRSGKNGVYAPTDIRNIWNNGNKDIYSLCSTSENKKPLYLSLLCDVLNFCMHSVFDAEEEIFSFSGTGIYINESVFLGNPGFSCGKRKRRHLVNLKKCHRISFPLQEAVFSSTGHRLIREYRILRKNILDIVQTVVFDKGSAREIFDRIRDLPGDSRILTYTDVFYEELTETLRVFTYAFDAVSHIYYIGIKEALRLIVCGDGSDDGLSSRAAVLSADMKLRSKLPNPDFYTSRGNALWK